MDYYPINLRDKLTEEGNLSLELTRIYACQLFRGLNWIHRSQVVHRDINPSNILLEGDKLVICDFGSAKKLNEDNACYVGCRSYRAPELILRCSYGKEVDVWAAGCVLVEMITGIPLF